MSTKNYNNLYTLFLSFFFFFSFCIYWLLSFFNDWIHEYSKMCWKWLDFLIFQISTAGTKIIKPRSFWILNIDGRQVSKSEFDSIFLCKITHFWNSNSNNVLNKILKHLWSQRHHKQKCVYIDCLAFLFQLLIMNFKTLFSKTQTHQNFH